MSFLTRLISAVTLGPLVIAILYYGGAVFHAFTIGLLAIAVYEFWNISRHEVKKRWRFSVLAFGIIYCLIAYFAMVDMRLQHGFFYTGLIVAGVWASDIGAYIFGRLIGGPKLAPAISPKKTWAGLAGACLFPVLILDTYILFFAEDRVATGLAVFIWSLIASVIIGLVGQTGDLFISILKRRVGLKDTGRLIPGHGGILDRIDAMMLVIIMFWMLLELRIILWP